MRLNAASGRLISACLMCVFCASCARIDHRPDLRQAADAFERASGVRPDWSDEAHIQELHIDEAGRLPLPHALQLALANNRALRADLEVIGQARAELVQSGLLPNPMLSLAVEFPDAGGLSRLTFGLSQDLAAIWLIPARKRTANAQLQQRILTLADTATELVKDVRTTYATLQYESVATELQQQNLRILEEAMEIAQARLRAGDATQLDVNLLRARHVEAEIDLSQLRNDFRIGQRSLLRLLGVAHATDSWQLDPPSVDSPGRASADQEDVLVEAALLQRLDVQAARWELESGVAEFEQQQLRVIQTLGIGVGGERLERRGLPDRDILADTARASLAAGKLTAPEIQSAGQRRKERSQEIRSVLGPSLEVPLPIFDQNQGQIAKAQFRARELEQRYQETEQRVIEGVRSAYTQRRQADDRARLYRDSLVPLQEANLELAQAAYRSGRESILTVLLAQGELIRARLAYAAAIRDLQVSVASLERQLAGRLSQLEGQPPTTGPTSQPGAGRGGQSISGVPGVSHE